MCIIPNYSPQNSWRNPSKNNSDHMTSLSNDPWIRALLNIHKKKLKVLLDSGQLTNSSQSTLPHELSASFIPEVSLLFMENSNPILFPRPLLVLLPLSSTLFSYISKACLLPSLCLCFNIIFSEALCDYPIPVF